MAPHWADSSHKHGIPREDQAWAIVHSTYSYPLERTDGQVLRLYIGNPHPQTEREIEILVRVYDDGREALVFHAMELGPKYRRFREEHPNV